MDLKPFETPTSPKDLHVSVKASWSGSRLSLNYRLSGASVSEIKNLFVQNPPSRKDKLWETTCFEAFIMPEGQAGYWEMNFSSGGSWNVYAFDSYREGMAPAKLSISPTVEFVAEKTQVRVAVSLDLGEVSELRDRPLRFSASMVIESQTGEKSYWSLVHSQNKADFHHREQFIATLVPEKQA